MCSLCLSLTTPTTLEHLKFKIVFEYNSNYYALFNDLRDADVWRHLDSIVTDLTGSRLQRVNIDISYNFHFDDNMEQPHQPKLLVLDALHLL